MAELLYRFQQYREKPPATAETHRADDFQRVVRRPSKFAAGSDVETYVQTCPACSADISLDHGDRRRCDCGLFLELYGNALTIWK